MRIAIKFGYDGRHFHGYARQPQLKTVEGEVIKTLVKHGFIEDTQDSNFRSASRTDKGVSALGNVVSFNTDSSIERVIKELNDGISEMLVYGFKVVKDDFYPRYANCRMYRYYLKDKDFDVDKVLSVAGVFAGTYDFSNFSKLEEFKDPLRTIDNVIVSDEGGFLILDFYAQTFLWNQVRRIVSAVESVGVGKVSREEIVEALHNPDKKVDFGLASAKPLFLRDVLYDFDFEYDSELYDLLGGFEKSIVTSL